MDRRNPRQSFALLALGLALGGCGSEASLQGDDEARAAVVRAPADVRVGARRLVEDEEELARIRGRRVGLVTNHTGIVATNEAEAPSTIDLLHEHPEVELVALFSPEHGIRGTVEAGESVDSSVDPATGLPIHSLYGDTRRPTRSMLEGVDVLLFDMQDVGARYYTYVSTLAYVMEVAGEEGIPVMVLDRPNPIGGRVQGNVLDPEFASFVGLYPVPMRHGMTVGELARMYVGEFGVSVDLHVVRLQGWQRDLRFSDTSLPWVAPSPNMPDETSALHYPGTCLFEGTVLSVGRGTDRPFQQVGAPGLDGEALARAMEPYDFPHVRFSPVRFTPVNPGDAKFPDQEVSGIRLVATGADYDPARVSVALMVEAARLLGDDWRWTGTIDRLAGTDQLRRGIDDGVGYEALVAGWDSALAEFLERREPYLLYR